MATLKIHGMPPSTFTRTVRMACHEKGIDYELVTTLPGDIGALNPFRKIRPSRTATSCSSNRPRSCATSSAPFGDRSFGQTIRPWSRYAINGRAPSAIL